jgi:hypothetical protein
MGILRSKEGLLFVHKKKQKNFECLGRDVGVGSAHAPKDKNFLVLF